MVNIQDLRGKGPRKEANNHTTELEEIVKQEDNYLLSKTKGLIRQTYELAETAGAGYLAGYVLSGGDQGAATQMAEYATVFWGINKVFLEMPAKALVKTVSKSIQKETNQPLNENSFYKNQRITKYWESLTAAKQPIRTAAGAMLGTAIGYFIMSSCFDLGNNIVDWVGPNPIEKGLELAHYGMASIDPIKEYITTEGHKHVGDFAQKDMFLIGASAGLVKTTRQFLIGNYRRLKARIKKEK